MFLAGGAICAAGMCAGPGPQGNQLSARVALDPNGITLLYDAREILRYQTAVHDVPAAIEPVYRRSAFVHPLRSPNGRVLTRIQPPDHYHHYGLWNPWTKVIVEGNEVDFWNLAKGQGTVRFAGLLGRQSHEDAGASFEVRQEHVQFLESGGERVVFDERLDIQARPEQMNGREVWLVDWTSRLRNLLDTPVELAAYRYGGGIGFRATDQWKADNTAVLTSEGKTRDEADGTRARWCDVRGWTDSAPAGILFLSHPANREHPEPMRVWPSSMKGMFFEFCPIRLNAWTLEPGHEYLLRYRLVVYDGTITCETAQGLWRNFANPTTSKVSIDTTREGGYQ